MTAEIRDPHETLLVALSLARAGWAVFPVRVEDGLKKPLVAWGEGATTDPEAITHWWTEEFPGMDIGVHLVKSGLMAVDIDRHDKAKNGFKSMKSARETHPLPKTFNYPTRGRGEHHIFLDPNPGAHRQTKDLLPGVDIKAGTALTVYYGPVLAKKPKLAPAPAWALLPARPKGEARFSGTLRDWMDALRDGEPSAEAVRVCELVKAEGVGHNEMLDLQIAIVREATVNSAGMRPLIEAARARWISHPHPSATADAWDSAFENSIPVQGAPDSRRPARRLSTELVRQAQAVFNAPKERTPATVRAGDFLTEKGKFLPQTFAQMLLPFVAWGVDDHTWKWDGTVWRQEKKLVEQYVARIMGDHLELAHVPKVKLALNDGRVPRLSPDPQQDIINVQNGVLDWRTGELMAHDPAQGSTVQLPVRFDRDADCPEFDRWLAEVVDPDVIQLAWEVIAYLLMSGNPFQKAIAFIGTGGNGKSTFIRVLETMMGDENISRVSLKLMAEDKFAPASMFGKLSNMVADIEGGYIKDTTILKMTTGGDTLFVQNKNKDGFTYKPWCVPVFSSNSIIRTNDRSKGFLRRWVTIQFPNEFLDGDLDEGILLAEIDGIFAKAMRILPELMTRGKFTETMSGEEMRRLMAEASNPVVEWLANDSRILAESDRAGDDVGLFEVKRDLLYDAFRNWAIAAGHTSPLSAGPFYSTLIQDPRFSEKKVRGLRVIAGIRLTSHFIPATEPKD